MSIDVLAIGELLADLIGTETAGGLADTSRFERYQGGSPANLCRTLALAGRQPALVACVGEDGLGTFLRRELAEHGVDTTAVRATPHAPTSLVLLARSAGTAEFSAYRHADPLLEPAHVPDDMLAAARIVHTTCFALSRSPARSTLLDVAARVAPRASPPEDRDDERAVLSIDANYAPSVWPARSEARTVVKAFCRHRPLVKVSTDDLDRLFASPDAPDGRTDPRDAVETLHRWGARLVCWTRGADGSVVSWDGGAQQTTVPAPQVEVVDATGAGDAFWAGFLHAWLRDAPPPDCAATGARVAARKLSQAGPLTTPISG